MQEDIWVTDENIFEECITNLEERAKPSKNDLRYEKYVKFINCFISKFGKERVYLVGSTGERSKLAFRKDNGDADFLLVSGKLEIPVTNLDPNPNVPCYVWIRADKSSRDIGLKNVEDKYLSADTLREVRPELFTLLRAVYLQITATVDRLPETDRNRTVLSVTSKVGLKTIAYRSLQFDGDIEKYKQHFKQVKSLEEKSRKRLDRWRSVKVDDQDKKIYRRMYEALKLALPSGDRRENNGGIAAFAQLVEDILTRQNGANQQRTPQEKCEVDRSADRNDSDVGDIVHNCGIIIKATYKEKNHKDFVPALIVKGKLACMKQWKKRAEACDLPLSKVTDIYNTDVFVVARVSPVNPNPEKDFCLSFNLAEQKLMNWMSISQRNVFLILKAFLKGVFERNHREKGRDLRLKTYHVKNLLFRFYEQNKEVYKQSVQRLLKKALVYLRERLCEENLPHYFVPSNNLFAEFGKPDFEILIQCVDEVQNNPIDSLNCYIELNDGGRGEVWFTKEELDCFLDMSSDGGRREHIRKLEDSMVDFQRGLNDKRDADGYCPLEEAILDTIKLCLIEDGKVDYSRLKLINDFVTQGQVDLSNLDTFVGGELGRAGSICCWFSLQFVWLMLSMGFSMLQVILLILYFGTFNSKMKNIVNKFGGLTGVRHIIRGAFCGKALDVNVDLEEQIVDTLRRYLTCSDEEEDEICSELKYKIACYFLCRKEFPDMSGIRRV